MQPSTKISDPENYLNVAASFARLLNEQKITPDEFAFNLLQHSILVHGVSADVARQIINGMSAEGRLAFTNRVRVALSPGFVVSVHIRGPRPGADHINRIGMEYTTRVHAWAVTFAAQLNLDEAGTPQCNKHKNMLE